MKWLIFSLVLLAGCCNPQKPKTNTTAPSLGGAKHSVTDAKDYLSRAQLSNRDIRQLIKELEGLRK